MVAAKHLQSSSVNMSPGQWGVARFGLMLIGLVCIVAVIAAAFMDGGSKDAKAHALAAYHMGFLFVLGLCLGSLGFVMISQQFNAGWSAAPRRIAESIASLMPFALVLFIPIAILEIGPFNGILFKWMNEAYTAGDVLYDKKAPFLNETFWVVRAAIYFSIWIGLSAALYKLSRQQDQTGDRWLTARMRFISSFGLLLFALSTAFASFDWLMSLDYHWFSTMFGVYFFAGSICSTMAVLVVILCSLRISGKLGTTFTQEHQHDLGKLLFAFTCFWAYITFCQYFLIWYGNIPEETAFYNLRKDGGYMPIFILLCVGHFIVPFVILLVRPIKRNPHTLRLVAVWMIVMHAADLYFMVRPQVKSVKPTGANAWVDIVGIVGPLALFLGLVLWKLSKAPLVPVNDPRLHEVVEHKNYV